MPSKDDTVEDGIALQRIPHVTLADPRTEDKAQKLIRETAGPGVHSESVSVLYTNESIVIDAETNKRLLSMINKRILPPMLFAYLMQALTKGTINTASIMGIQVDTKMVGQDYALTNTFLYVGLLVGQLPLNRITQVFPLGKLLAGSLISWGVFLFIMGFMRDYRPIFVLRLLLGFGQAVFGPCLVRMSTVWYRKKTEQPVVTAAYQSMLGLASIISSLLGYGFYTVHGTALAGWQYLFISIACLSIVLGVYIGFTLPDSPTTANCYSEADKVLLVERVRGNDQGIQNKTWKREQAIEALFDPCSWLLAGMTFVNALVMGGFAVFNNILVNSDFHFGVQEAQLLIIPTGVITVLLYMLSSWLVNKTHQTFYVMFFFALPGLAGNIVLLTVVASDKTKFGLLISLYVMQSFGTENPLIWMLLSRNIAGQTKKTVSYALTFAGTAGGNVIAPLLFESEWAPRYIDTLRIHTALYCTFFFLAGTTRIILARRNAAKRRVSGGKELHTLAFEDLTDRKNPEFLYSL